MNIKEILPIQSYSGQCKDMYIFIINKLTEMNIPFYTERGNIYGYKDTNNLDRVPCFVSHIDTVHNITDEIHVLEFNKGNILTGFNRVKMKPTGIGGDDKVGIYYCFRALEELDDVKVAFFRDEEIGCVGSNDADMNFFSNVSMCLQGDRKGNADFITRINGIDMSNKEFQDDVSDIVETHGYKFNTNGGLTDVCALRGNGLTVPVVNISCGYYAPHTANEYINVNDMENGLRMYLEIAECFGNKEYIMEKYTAPTYNYSYNSYNKNNEIDYLDEGNILEYGDYVWCDEVNNFVHKDDAYYDFTFDQYFLNNTTNYRLMPDDYDLKEYNKDYPLEYDYYEISLTNGDYFGIEVDSYSTSDEVKDVILNHKNVKKPEDIVKINKINEDIYRLCYDK